jgi:S-adenosylmethionine hydrolase
MPVVTLTTDWGLRDHYLAAFKGRLISRMPDVRLVDVSHSIQPYNVLDASYILKNAYPHFPSGSIHYSGIKGKTLQGVRPELTVVSCDGHYFIGLDSGIFSLMLGDKQKTVHAVPGKGFFNSYDWVETIVDSICRLVEGQHPADFAQERPGVSPSFAPQPVADADSIRASVIFIDDFENLVLNVRQEFFEKIRKNREFNIELRALKQPLKRISQWYHEVEEGELVALFNRDGYLEVALNRANASGLLGVNLYDSVRISFQE